MKIRVPEIRKIGPAEAFGAAHCVRFFLGGPESPKTAPPRRRALISKTDGSTERGRREGICPMPQQKPAHGSNKYPEAIQPDQSKDVFFRPLAKARSFFRKGELAASPPKERRSQFFLQRAQLA